MTLTSYFALFRPSTAPQQPGTLLLNKPARKRRNSHKAIMASALALVILGAPLTGFTQAKASSVSLPSASSLSGSYLSGRSALFFAGYVGSLNLLLKCLDARSSQFHLMDRAFITALANGQIDKALPLANRILDEDKEHFLAQLTTAAKRIHDGNYENELNDSVTQNVNPLSRLTFAIVTAWELAGQDKPKQAVEELTKIKGPKWFELFVNYNAGLIAEYSGDARAAADFYKTAYEIDRGALRNAISYSRMLAASGRQKEALDIIAEYENSSRIIRFWFPSEKTSKAASC